MFNSIVRYIVLLLCVVAGCLCDNNQDHEDNIINTSLGKIQGSLLKTRFRKIIFTFRAIRYAKAPVGDLRFKPPVPSEKWDGIYNATVDGPVCPQPGDDPVSEDCLFLNVYSTKLPSQKNNPKRPVIIFLHPGGFYGGTGRSDLFGPQYFMDQDIVLVTLNFRLATLGFISTGDKYAPGNNGLKDQVIAMRWVRDNIEYFGGDPNAVTLYGYSCGSTSIYLHMVSPMSKGLFHKAIASSHFDFGILPEVNNQFYLAQKQARFMGCSDDTSEKIISCLKTKPANDIGNSFSQFSEFGIDPIVIWTPVIEDDWGQERFLTDNSIKLLREGKFMKIPIITGLTRDEMAFRAWAYLLNVTLFRTLDTQFEKYAPIAFVYERNTPKSKQVSQTIRKYYFGNRHIDITSIGQLGKVYIDSIIGFPTNKAVKLMATYNDKPVYYYRFTYRGRYSFITIPLINIPLGVIHHDDLMYSFYISKYFPFFKPTDPEYAMVDKMTTLYANFAKTGNVTSFHTNDILKNVNWETFNMSTQKYLDIGKKLVIKDHLEEERYQMWEKLYPLSENN